MNFCEHYLFIYFELQNLARCNLNTAKRDDNYAQLQILTNQVRFQMFNLNKKFDARAAVCCLIASETIVSNEK